MSTTNYPSTPGSPRMSRAKLRHATFIDPQTATKSKRTFSLTPVPTENGNSFSNGSNTPLLQDEPESPQDPDRFYWLNGPPSRWNKVKEYGYKAKDFAQSETGKSMFKCALAYLLGSMATFVPFFSSFFGRQDSKHLVATITVYFHPARSLGSMFDATILAFIAFIYTAFVSIVSMSMSVLFTDKLHQPAIGHAIILVLFVGGGLGFVGWVKLKKGDPLVNIACSLTSLSLITVLTKEGAVQDGNYSFYKISQILKMIIAGVICTMLVSFLIFPSSGRRNLKKNMTDVSDQLSDMLGLITRSFISGDEHELEDHDYVAVSDQYKKSSAKVAANLKEAKYEHYFFGDERVAALESRLAQCLQMIGQSIGGLRSAAAMQFVIANVPLDSSDPRIRKASLAWSDTQSLRNTAGVSGPRSEPEVPSKARPKDISRRGPNGQDPRPWRTPQQIFELFIQHLGPSMRSLAYTLKEILDDLPFDPDNDYSVAVNPRFELSLERALSLYRENRKEALKAVYDKKDMDRNRPIEVEADWEEAAACCGHFSFSLLEVAEQIKHFLHCLDDLQIEVEDPSGSRSWSWLKFWRRGESPVSLLPLELYDTDHNKLKDIPDPQSREARDRQYWEESQKSKWKQGLSRQIYNLFALLRQEDNKFAIKVGFGAMLYALPSYISATRPIYSRYRGEWGLLSYMLVCSMTIGASNTTGAQRFLGTALGAVLALVAWEISGDNPVVLAFFGFLMAYWTAWIIIGKGKGPMGRFIMLTYNLSCLYAYSLLIADDLYDDDGDEEDDKSKHPLVYSIAGHRVVAVLSGVIWGLIITRAVWPISARQKLKDGISLLWLRMGLIWKRDPLAVFTEGESDHSYMNLREENDLQRFLAKLQGLVDASKHEFELRRPFPHNTYDKILKSTNRMLEAFHAMSVVIQKDANATPGELALLKATTEERSELCARLSHQFSVLASSVKLECSIATDVLPSANHTRDRLLARIFSYRKEDADEQKTDDEDYSLLYTYALVTGQLGMEVMTCLKEVEDLFGVLDEESLMLQ
ncbi:hypothetical protein PMZ80_006160 [Knufia obscura]|uniref:Integral membrane bound transporter domain-containing protein n=1 Tax=Knufia obscura TaxID=1635080 RepID=A0ABR0RNQ4_9EURO|nr:hypothetical protein PMZ80_006160 [Knufia obscura]